MIYWLYFNTVLMFTYLAGMGVSMTSYRLAEDLSRPLHGVLMITCISILGWSIMMFVGSL